MAFEAIRDQDVAVKMLRTALRKGRLAHAYLFEGPVSVGKELTALTFARAVNCEETRDDSCDECGSCVKIAAGRHPDVSVIEPTKAGRIIHKEAMETLVASASLKPYEAAYRISVILDAERMHVVAANRFLKTLEEPPGKSLFVLLSQNPNQLLPTIASRCQRVKFGPLTPHTVERILIEERGVAQERARVISLLAQGQMSTAFDLAGSEKREFVARLLLDLGQRRNPLVVAQDFIGRLGSDRNRIKDSLKKRQKAAEEESDDLAERMEARSRSLLRKEVLSYLDLLRVWYRDISVFAHTGLSEQLWNSDSLETITELAEQCGQADVHTKLDAIARAQRLLEQNVKEERVFKELFFSLGY